ncbi:hypothetical protein LCGC14_0426590 [marine sediment metagenome]|uniref:Uncharacterized protein n=1 Tax=marine sediment metagenome TaxID=412755 RepID=A0A0F9VBF6_9ZZZZ
MFEVKEHTCDIVEIKLEPHPNADSLSLVMVGDFQCAVRTEDWKDGDLAVYIPPDSVVPQTKDFEFLGKHLRIKARKLRGEWSVGLLIPSPQGAKIGDDYMDKLGIIHYEPQISGNFTMGGDNVRPPKQGDFPKYDVLNFRKYSELFNDGEEVIVTEKIHGCVNSQALISMPNGERHRMQDLADTNYNGEILGYDCTSNTVVTTRVRRVYKNGLGDKWLKIKFDRHRAGRGSYFGSLKCTPDHKIFVVTQNNFGDNDNGFIEATHLAEGDTIRLLRSEFDLTPIQEQVLIGKMLGDGSYSHNDYTGFVRFCHKKDHEDYLVWTEEALGEICGNRQTECISGYGTRMVRSKTVSNAFIKDLFDDWFTSNKKEVPTSIIQKLGPIALAFWYMDDGNLCHHENQEDRALFSTNGFSEQSVDNLVLALAKFDIHAIKYQSSGWRIRLNCDDAEKLFLVIAPYVPQIMQYKLPERYRGHKGWMPSKDNVYKQICVDQKITQIDRIEENRQRYDIETDTHNYFANGVLIHNCNARFTCVDDVIYCGSRRFWKKEDSNNLWWKALHQNTALEAWLRHHQDLVVYGEIFGQVQSLKYGATGDRILFASFDIRRGSQWLDFDEAHEIGAPLPWVPLVYRGPFDKDMVLEFAERDSLWPGAQHYREGVVIKPVHERTDRKIGRVQLKVVGNRYLSKS